MAACVSGAVADPLTSVAERGLTAWVEMIPKGAGVCVCALVCVCLCVRLWVRVRILTASKGKHVSNHWITLSCAW